MNSLQKKYIDEVAPTLLEQIGCKSLFEIPSITKVTVNVGLSNATTTKEFIEDVKNDLMLITGQKPVVTEARKSIAGFKIRAGQTVGMKVTLRGRRMWDFLYRLIGTALPRIKDFQGLDKKCFDGQGNLNIGIVEQTIFPEIATDEVQTVFGFQVNITTRTDDYEGNVSLMRLLGFPIKKD